MSLPTHACTRCTLPVHNRGSRCRDCIRPYAQETAMPAQRHLIRPADVDEHEKGEHWAAYRACGDADPTLFHEPSGHESASERRERIADAKSYCDRCPVTQECLDGAFDEGDAVTIRGGLTAAERDDIARARRGRWFGA
ncbi:WhiB family transcriptional regulator [Cellulomonas cellasea]|uniref:WhiB family transcriptional regulator n=1 Tax=Cellulomonas cellasea TaxID=43670 RepID=UPI0025A39376|nr:WhiB family transcriptional regulator [Cellulomonas cellasea]MDM8084719.1 WhiB family transcriptional regulator [Cellulomonas cellasea]